MPAPSAYSRFPADNVGLSERWARTRYTDLRYYGAPQRGGHFAAYEAPGEFVGEVRAGHSTIGLIMSRRFAYAIDKRYWPLLVPFGLRASKDGVTLTDEGFLSATFGFFKIKTPLANVTEAHITRNYRWWTAFGVRGSMVDDGLSFGTNHNAGVCIHFAEKVPSPLRRSGHSALTVTVADLEGLTSALGAGQGEASSASPP